MGKINPGLYSSERHDWQTPPEIYEPILRFIDLEQFDVDPFCSSENIPAIVHACSSGFTGSDSFDGFDLDWHRIGSLDRFTLEARQPIFWVNPPYGPDLKRAMKKCSEEAKKGCKIWALVPVRTESIYQYDLGIADAGFTVFLKGKISYLKEGEKVGKSTFGSMLLYWGDDADELAKRWAVEQPLPGTVMMRVKP